MCTKEYFVVVRLHKVVLRRFNHFLKNGSWGALHNSDKSYDMSIVPLFDYINCSET